MLTLRTQDIMIFGGMNEKLLQENYFLKNAKKTCKPNNRELNCDWKKGERTALQELSEGDDIVVITADKSGA